MAHVAIGPTKSYQLISGEEGVRGQSMLVEFAKVVATSQVVTFYRGSGTDTTGAIYCSGIDFMHQVIGTPDVGDTATTTVSCFPVTQYVNGPTTLAIWKTDAAATIYRFTLFGISYGN